LFLPYTESEEIVNSVWVFAQILEGGQQLKRGLTETLQHNDNTVRLLLTAQLVVIQ